MFELILIIIFPAAIILLIIIQGFFTNSEMAVVSSNHIHLKYLAKKGNKKAAIIQKLLNDPDRLFGTTLLAINLATVAVTILTKYYFKEIIKDNLIFIDQIIPFEVLIIIILEPIIVLFGELLPMSIARKYPNTTALRNAVFIRFAYSILFPFMFILSVISKTISKFFQGAKSHDITREELKLLVTGRFSNINYKTQEYIKEIFNINELTASDVMVHLDKVIAVSENSTVGEVKDVISESNHSRIPVFKNDIFNIVSTIHVLNLLGVDDKEQINQYTDKLYIIPSSKPIMEILKELKGNRKYMGIVVDEYGAVCGVLTLKDILEEIIGEYIDEFDTEEDQVDELDENIFDAHIRLDDFFDETGIDLKNENAETLAGVINLKLGRIGRKKEKIELSNFTFEIVEATNRAVKLVKLLNKNKQN